MTIVGQCEFAQVAYNSTNNTFWYHCPNDPTWTVIPNIGGGGGGGTAGVSSINGEMGDITLAAGANVTISSVGTTITITATASGGGITPPVGDIGGNVAAPTVVSTHLTVPLPKAQGGTGTATPSLIQGSNVTITGTWPNQTIASAINPSGILPPVGDISGSVGAPTVTSTHLVAPLPVAQGGTGTTSPTLIQGSNVTITGSWPNQTINSTASGSGTVTHTVGSLTSGQLVVGNAAADIKVGDLTGDVTTTGTTATTLATVNSNVGTFTTATITVNGKGLITAASSGTGTFTKTIASGTQALGTSPIAPGASASTIVITAAGVLTTDNVLLDFNQDPTGVTGYNPSTGVVQIFKWPGSGTINIKVSNPTGLSITPGAMTVNYRAIR